MIGLCRHGLGWRTFKRSVLLQGLVIWLHLPSFAIDCGQTVIRQGRITRDQIQHTRTAAFVYEDLLDEHQWKIDPFQIDFPPSVRFRHERFDWDVATLLLVFS